MESYTRIMRHTHAREQSLSFNYVVKIRKPRGFFFLNFSFIKNYIKAESCARALATIMASIDHVRDFLNLPEVAIPRIEIARDFERREYEEK